MSDTADNTNNNDQTSNQETDIDYEGEARTQGWVPREEFKGPEAKWVDAETFVRRGWEIQPILRKNNERLLKEIEQLKQQNAEVLQSAASFKEYQKEIFERKTREMQQELLELRELKKQAISSGDGERVLAIEDRMAEINEEQKTLKKEPETTTAQEQSFEPDATLQSWMSRNEWFGKNKRLTGFANGIGDEIREEMPHLVGEAFLEELDARMAEHLEKTGNKSRGNPVESGSSSTRATTSTKKRSYENLPQEAKAICDRYVKDKLLTREEYVANYDWN